MGTIENTPAARISEIAASQKAYFRSGATLSEPFRRTMLRRFDAAMVNWEKRLCDALWQDLHKSPEEAYLTEISIVRGEIRKHLRHLKEWMRPERRPTPLKLLPSKSRIINGYKYRQCSQGKLGEVKTDKCTYKEPSNLLYQQSSFELVLGTNIEIPVPTYNNLITKFTSDKPLPVGLTLDETTGKIYGKPTAETALASFVITGENPIAATQTTITITVRKGHCVAEGFFPTTRVGEVATFQCALQGSYVGSQQRYCALGEKDGEWKKASGVCIPIAMTVILIVVILVIILVVVFLVIRTTRRTKAVGGVKGKKAIKKTTAPKKANEKKVKV